MKPLLFTLLVLTSILHTFDLYGQQVVTCKSKKTKRGEMTTCLFGDYKVTHEVWEEDGNKYASKKIQWYRRSSKDYQPISTSQIFNNKGSELLAMYQDTINNTWNSLINDPETSGCIMEGVTDTSDITFDKIDVLVSTDGIDMSSSLGLNWSCMNNDIVTAFYPWNVIDKFIKF